MKRYQIHILNLVLVLFFVGNWSYGQSFDIKNLHNRNNLNSLQFNLAATKLCKDFYAKNDLTEARQNKTSFRELNGYSGYGCHLCVEKIRYPFMSPLEIFLYRFQSDRRILQNKSNVFALRALRKEINDKYLEEYEKMVNSTDTENLVFHKYDLIKGYSFDTNELFISLWSPHIKNLLAYPAKNDLVAIPLVKGHGINEKGHYVHNGDNTLAWFRIPMPEPRAQEVYDRYKNHYRPNPPFAIATRLSYALRMGKELQGAPRYFQVVLKKVEFFLPNENDIKAVSKRMVENIYDPVNKIAEVTFDETLNYTEKGLCYQEIKTIK